ncbi:MAG TPA: TRAP transporter small permease [Casimicrobiaceae bacterium]
MSEVAAEHESAGAARVARQYASLPRAWRSIDRAVVRATEGGLFVIGALFTIMITLEVVSRYVFSFSIFFVNAAARLLLVWFFLLGAGIALRHGTHVGFELILGAMAPRRRRLTVLFGQLLALVFFIEMVWGGLYSLGPALNQTEAGLDISLAWAFAAIPIGFALLIYHMLLLMVVEIRQQQEGEPRR